MALYIQSVDYELWRIVVKGPYRTIKIVDGQEIPKDMDELDRNEMHRLSQNAKAISLWHCALDISEYNRISNCTSAKEIWDKLQICYKGTNQVKETKIDLLQLQYETFKMELNESMRWS